MGSYIVYNLELLSEILAEQAAEEKERRDKLFSSLVTYSLFLALGIGVVLGCMVNAKRT